jgi:hypothetical protein
LRRRAVEHIDLALRHLAQGIADNYPQAEAATPVTGASASPPEPSAHPAYRRALVALRLARAHLDRPGQVTTRTASIEAVAIAEIEAARGEIRGAAADDGRSRNDDPRIDPALTWPGRLHRSLELLRDARFDCEQAENEPFARELRDAAVRHIDAAIESVEQGIKDDQR